MRINKIFLMLSVFALLLTSYSNCGKLQSGSIGNNEAINASTWIQPAESNPATSPTSDSNSGTPTLPPVTTPPTPANAMNGYGTVDTNCMASSAYDACLFWKNPVAQRNAVFPEILKMGTDLSSVQTYGVKLQNQISSNTLTSATIRVVASDGTTPQLTGGQLRFPYGSDGSKAWTAQLMSYFWLTKLETEFIKRVGTFYAASGARSANRPIDVDSFGIKDTTMKGNAYFSKSENKIAIGYAVSEAGGIAHEMALSSEVYIHEMGHANLASATASNLSLDVKTRCVVTSPVNGVATVFVRDCNRIYTTDTMIMKYCSDVNGCPGAINEGQADFHVFMMFPNTPAIGETWQNKLDGAKAAISRNPLLTKSVTASYVYSNFTYTVLRNTPQATAFKGEIHDGGAFYASLLYDIYTDPNMNKSHFEKLFNEHLKTINETSDFRTALADFKNLATAMKSQFGIDYGSLISSTFARRGIL